MKIGRQTGKGIFALTAGVAFLALYACGGGGGGYGGGGGAPSGTGTAIIAKGAMTKGSVIVNGVRYTAAAGYSIRIDDNPGRPETELRDGMEAKVKGRINNDRITGEYDKVEVEPDARGKLGSKGVDDFFVNGQHVFVDDSTIFEDRVAGAFSTISFNDLADLNEVEIHGGRDDAGNIRATRVERRDDGPLDEVKGTISTAPNGSTFTLTNGTFSITVNYSGAVISPTGATLNLNDFVEVHGTFSGGTLTATLVDREDLEDAEFEPAEGQDTEVEGFISGFTAHPGSFHVGEQAVNTTASTVFEGGIAADLDNGMKVEAEGHIVSGTLVAEKIKFKRTVVRIQATVTAHSASSVTLLDRTIMVNSLTRLNVALNSIVDNTDRVEMRGYEDKSGALIAVRIDSAGGGKDFLQAPVTAKDAAARTLVLLSGGNAITANLTTVSENNFKDTSGNAIGSAAFFAAVTPATSTTAGTLVKVKGTYSAGTITGEEAELEN